jgi:hypothetical protein
MAGDAERSGCTASEPPRTSSRRSPDSRDTGSLPSSAQVIGPRQTSP